MSAAPPQLAARSPLTRGFSARLPGSLGLPLRSPALVSEHGAILLTYSGLGLGQPGVVRPRLVEGGRRARGLGDPVRLSSSCGGGRWLQTRHPVAP